jgi:hypothetical protein
MMKALQAQRPTTVADNLQAQIGGGQAAIPLRDSGHRLVFVRNNGDSYVLPSLAGHEAMVPQIFVINDGVNSLSVWCWPGDTLNGTLNSSLSVPAGSVGIFIKVDTGSLLDWRGTVLS